MSSSDEDVVNWKALRDAAKHDNESSDSDCAQEWQAERKSQQSSTVSELTPPTDIIASKQWLGFDWKKIAPIGCSSILLRPACVLLARLNSGRGSAHLAEIHSTQFANALGATAMATLTSARERILSFVKSIAGFCKQSTAGGVYTTLPLSWRTLMYDSTPGRTLRLKMRTDLGNDMGSVVEEETMEHAKIFHLDSSFRLVVRRGSNFLNFRCREPSSLAFLQSGRGEDYHAARTRSYVCGFGDLISLAGVQKTRFVEATIIDADGANERCELMDEADAPEIARVTIKCTVHKKIPIVKRTSAAMDNVDSSLIRVALYVRDNVPQGSTMVRREMRTLIDEQYVHNVGGMASADALSHRQQLFDLCLPSGPSNMKRRAVLERVFNDDVRVPGIVQRNCRGGCRSPRHGLFTMKVHGVAALLPKGIPPIQRTDWTGVYENAATICLPSNVHALFLQALLRLLPKLPTQMPRGVGATPAICDGDVDGKNDDAGQLDHAAEQQVEGAPLSLFKEDDKTRAGLVRSWCLSGRMQNELFLFVGLMQKYDVLVKSDLQVNGQHWRLAQQKASGEKKDRLYPVLVAYDCTAEFVYLRYIGSVIFGSMPLPLVGERSEEDQLQTYIVYIQSGGVCYLRGVTIQRWFPFKLYDCWRRKQAVDELKGFRLCTVGKYAKNVIEYYGSRGLGGPLFMEDLGCGLEELLTNTALAERAHGE